MNINVYGRIVFLFMESMSSFDAKYLWRYEANDFWYLLSYIFWDSYISWRWTLFLAQVYLVTMWRTQTQVVNSFSFGRQMSLDLLKTRVLPLKR